MSVIDEDVNNFKFLALCDLKQWATSIPYSNQ